MDDADETNRERKVAGREKGRRYAQSGRSYLHAMTASRVKRARELLEKTAKRDEPEKRPDQGS